VRLRPVLPVFLAALLATALTGCARKAENLVGADRLIRGPGGLGTTFRVTGPPDRDTFLENGTTVTDSLLIVGTSGTFQARSLLYFSKVNLPDTTKQDFTPQSISLEFTRNLTIGPDSTTVDVFQTTVWDSATVAWPGPAAGALLGSAGDARTLASYSLPLGNATFPLAVQWAKGVVSPRFLIQAQGGQPLAAYVAPAVRLRIISSHTGSTGTVQDTVYSPVTRALYVHAPLSPSPTGADSILVWGGLFETEIAVHFPADSIPSNVSVDEATLILNLAPGSAIPAAADAPSHLEIRASRGSWSEGVTERSSLPALDVNAAARADFRLSYSSVGNRFAIRLPGFLVREWIQSPSTNGGVVVTLVNRSNLGARFLIRSRESSEPPELHVSYTELPPGRL